MYIKRTLIRDKAKIVKIIKYIKKEEKNPIPLYRSINKEFILNLESFEPKRTKTIAYNLIIDFENSYSDITGLLKERGKTWEDIKNDIIDFLFHGYYVGEINFYAYAHTNTKDFHIHMIVLNRYSYTNYAVSLQIFMKMVKYYSNYLREIYGLRHNYEKVPLEEAVRKLAIYQIKKERLIARYLEKRRKEYSLSPIMYDSVITIMKNLPFNIKPYVAEQVIELRNFLEK